MKKNTNPGNSIKYLLGKMGRDLRLPYQKDLASFFDVTPPTLSSMVREGVIYAPVIEKVLQKNQNFEIGTIALLDYIIGGRISFNFSNEFDHQRLSSFIFRGNKYINSGESITADYFQKTRLAEISNLLKFIGEEEAIERRKIEIEESKDIDDEIHIKLLPVRVNAGSGFPPANMPNGVLTVSKFLIGKYNASEVFGAYVDGESMTNEGIVKDTLIICKEVREIDDLNVFKNKIVVAIVDGVLVVKKMVKDEKGNFHLKSMTNSKAEDYDLSFSEFRIIGTVINSIKWH